jgi:hypothetical protein
MSMAAETEVAALAALGAACGCSVGLHGLECGNQR